MTGCPPDVVVVGRQVEEILVEELDVRLGFHREVGLQLRALGEERDTDVNIESELLKASGIVPRSKDVVDKLLENFSLPVEFANAAYYRKGTPRYFEYVISDYPINKQPQNEIDGYINLVFNESLTLERLVPK